MSWWDDTGWDESPEWREGYHAYPVVVRGGCPYVPGSTAASDWQRGWDEGKRVTWVIHRQPVSRKGADK